MLPPMDTADFTRLDSSRPDTPLDTPLDTVRRMLACFSAGDAEGQLEHCADDVVYEAPYYGIERHGQAELAAMLASVQERFDEVSYVVVDDFPTVDPDLVIVEVRGDNRVREPGQGSVQGAGASSATRTTTSCSCTSATASWCGGGSSRTPTSTERRSPNDRTQPMTGVLDGLTVLDLTTGIAGPVTGMLLADHGAQVTKIEPPGGDPTRAFSGAQVWHRGKRSAVLDLEDPTDRERVRRARCARRRAGRELRAGRRGDARPRPRHVAGPQPSPRALLDHRLRRRRRARRPSRGRRPGRGAHRAPVGEPRRPRRHAGAPGRDPTGVPRPRRPRRLLGRRAPPGPAALGGAVGEHGVGVHRHPRHQRRAPRARADRARAARVDLAVPGCARHHALGLAADRARRHAELPELDQRPAGTEGRVPLCRRPVDPPVGAAPRLRHQRRRRRPRAAHREDHAAPRGDHAHRHGRQRDAPAAPLPTAHGRGDRQVPVGAVGGARRRGGRPAPAAALTRGGAARPRVPRRRLRGRGRRSRARPGASGRTRLRPARVSHRRARRTADGRRPHRRGAAGGRRARRRHGRDAHLDARRLRRRSPECGWSTSGSRSRDRGAR